MINRIAVWVLPLAVTLVLSVGALKGVKVFELFRRGAEKGLSTVYGIFPTVMALTVAVTMLVPCAVPIASGSKIIVSMSK